MINFVRDIEKETLENTNFRKVLLTSKFQQLVVMSLLPNDDIGSEVHNLDQFIKIEKGEGVAVLNGEKFNFYDGFSISIPKGTTHNIINTSSSQELKLYTIYSPPEHEDGTIHPTKQDALNAEKGNKENFSQDNEDFSEFADSDFNL